MSLDWAFVEKPTETFNIICHVLQQCSYDLILGSKFLKMTETLSNHRHRLVKCLPPLGNALCFKLLDDNWEFLEGTLAGSKIAFAVPDTGAEGNVMDLG